MVRATGNTTQSSEAGFVDLGYLASHMSEFENCTLTTSGIARTDGGSIYMFEDFWLQDQDNASARMPVVVRFAGLSKPTNGTFIEISGRIEHSSLEGGFYYLNASSWTAEKVPELTAFTLLIVLLSTLTMLVLLKRIHKKTMPQPTSTLGAK